MAHFLLSYQTRQLEAEPEGGERLTACRGAGSQASLLARAMSGTLGTDS
jgi:hypothetical protein